MHRPSIGGIPLNPAAIDHNETVPLIEIITLGIKFLYIFGNLFLKMFT
jgi:hypothetical protein